MHALSERGLKVHHHRRCEIGLCRGWNGDKQDAALRKLSITSLVKVSLELSLLNQNKGGEVEGLQSLIRGSEDVQKA